MQKKERLLKNLFKDASIYGLGTILVRASGILLIPFYWKWLTPEDFGVFAIFQVVVQFISIVMDWGLSGAIQRSIHEWSQEEAPKYIGAAFLFQFLLNLALMVLFIIFAEIICDTLFNTDNFYFYFKIAIFNSFLSTFTNIPQSIYRSLGMVKKYTSLSVLQFLTTTFLSIFYLVYLKMELKGYIYAQVLSNLIFAIVYLPDLLKRMKLTLNKHYFKDLLSFALPTVPAGMLDGVGGVFDRFFLDHYVSVGVLGIYSLSKQVAGVYNLFLVSLKSAWLPMIYRVVSTREDGDKVLGRITVQYVYVIAVLGIFISSTVKDVIYLMKMPKYYSVADYAPLIVLAFFFQGVGHVTGRGLDLTKRTNYYWIMYVVGITSGIYAILKLAPFYGVWGAGIAFLISIIAREIVQFVLSYYFYPRPIAWGRFFAFVPYFAISYALCAMVNFPNSLTNIIVKLIILAILSLLYAVYVFGPTMVKQILTKIMSRFK